jgi:hypothetical protein
VAVWVLILAVPKTRALLYYQLGIQAHGDDPMSPSVQEIQSIQSLSKKYPDDAKVQAYLIQIAPSYPKDKLRKYDNLIERFPNAIWLIQDRLRQSTSGKFKTPNGSYAIEDNANRTPLQSQNWLSPSEIKQTLKIVLLGEKEDPQNSFYNWIEAMCWYGLQENSKALDAFQRGSRKHFYDDGTLQDVKNRLYVQRLLIPVLVEDREMALSAEFFPHYANMRNFTRAAIWQGGMQEKAGNHQRALEIYEAQMRMSSVMYKDSKWIIGKLVARALLQVTWDSLTRVKPSDEKIYQSNNKKDINALFVTQAQRFADYANAHGRADLANQAISIANNIVQDPLTVEQYPTAYIFLLQRKLNSIGLLKWSGTELLKVLLIAIGMWLCIFPLSYLLNRGLRTNSKFNFTSIKPLDVVLSTTFVLLCVVTGVIFVLSRINDRSDLYSAMFSSEFLSNSEPFTMFTILTTWIPWVTFALIFICSFLPCCWKMRKSTFVVEQTAPRQSNPATRISLVIGKVLLALLFIALQITWITWISYLNFLTRSPLLDFCIYATIPLPAILFFILLWYWKRPQTPRMLFATPTFWLYCTTMLQQSLGLLVLVCTLSYGLTVFASLPFRAQATTIFEQFLTVGEVTVLSEAIQRDKAQNPDANAVE